MTHNDVLTAHIAGRHPWTTLKLALLTSVILATAFVICSRPKRRASRRRRTRTR